MDLSAALGALLLCCGCSTEHVSVLTAPVTPPAAAASAPLHVVVDATAVHLPLHVAGENVVFSDLDSALERSVDVETTPLRERARQHGPRPLELFVELVQARAELSEGRLLVELTTRATLREKSGGAYLAQTHARASAAGAPTPAHGVAVVRRATDAVAAKVADFLAGALPP